MEENIQDDTDELPPGTMECFIILSVRWREGFPDCEVQTGVRMEVAVADDLGGLALYDWVVDRWNRDRREHGLTAVPADHVTLHWWCEPLRFSSVRTPQGEL